MSRAVPLPTLDPDSRIVRALVETADRQEDLHPALQRLADGFGAEDFELRLHSPSHLPDRPDPLLARMRRSRVVTLRATPPGERRSRLIGHIGGHESLGTIRLRRTLPFTAAEEDRLRMILPALTRPIRSQVLPSGREAALVNAAGEILWATDGFPFRWGALAGSPPQPGRLPMAMLLVRPDWRRLGRALLELAGEDGPRTGALEPGLAGRADAAWTTWPGAPLGCIGRVMLLELAPAAADILPMPARGRAI